MWIERINKTHSSIISSDINNPLRISMVCAGLRHLFRSMDGDLWIDRVQSRVSIPEIGKRSIEERGLARRGIGDVV